MTRRVNQTTGREEELMPDGSWVPVTTPSPLTAATTPGGVSPPSPSGFGGGSTASPSPSPTPRIPYRNTPIIPGTADRATRLEDFSAGVLNWGNVPLSGDWNYNLAAGLANTGIDVSNWLNEPGPNAINPVGQVDGFGSGVGAAAGQHAVNNPTQPLTFGSGILPEDQAYIDAITQALSGLGGGSTVQAPQLPEIPTQMFEADPGLQTMADHAGRRQTQIDDLISTLRADSQSTLDRNTNKWVTLGRWLSDWSSTGDWAQAGAAMTRVLAQNEDMRRELRDETLQYIQMGWSAEDAVVQAQAALLSGQAQARRELAAAQYNRGTAQTQLDFNAQVANSESASRGASTRANAALAIAEALRDAQGRARESRSTAAQALAGDPRYSNQAFGVLAGNVTDDPATQQALTGSMAEQQLNMALMGYVAQYAGSDDRQALRFLQQWDPRLRLNDLQNATPQQLMLRLVRTPESRQAFARNRDYLLRSQQFGGMVAPAQ